eukprot:39355-Eustigmatos_ZCMA.PRE.1
MLTRDSSTNALLSRCMSSGVSSYPPIALGRPAFEYTDTKHSEILDRRWRNGRICFAPSAQFKPTQKGLTWRTDTGMPYTQRDTR